ncbi:hypothetical protein H2204_009308 [Knufia peltigerae]|uniref:Uncharacterized protein n=1 Tax=Knufia peltigerae TaxID=1002370 RepID=A0AA38XY73_9EURO|nr:hypothetical protein H2204_009308 [Knufia peltigerae]
MTTTTSARMSSSQSQTFSKLSYTNASISEGHENLPSLPETDSCSLPTQKLTKDSNAELGGDRGSSEEHQQCQPRLTIRQLREQAQNKILEQHAKQVQQEKDSQPSSIARPVQQQQQKKKSSVFGGLFQKEPSQAALDQVKAQLKAQHGSTSATKVPNVSLEQMPKHVPKVNSKWDGIPDGVKKREKERKAREKEQDKFAGANSLPFYDSGYHSREGQDGDRRRLDSRNSSSTTGSFGRYEDRGSSSSRTNSTRAHYYAPSVNSSGDLASQQRSDLSRPTTLSFDSNAASMGSEDDVPRSLSAAVDQEVSSAAPVSLHQILQSCTEDDCEVDDEVNLASSGPGVLGSHAASKSNRDSIGPGFLAGEAEALVFPNKNENDQQSSTTYSSPRNGKVSNQAALKTSSSSSRHLHPPAQDKKKSPARGSMSISESSSRGTASPRTKLSSSFGLFSKEKEHRTK